MFFFGVENRAPKMMGDTHQCFKKWHASKMKAPIFVSLESWENVTLLEKYGVQEEELSVNIPWSILCFVSVSQLVPDLDFAHQQTVLDLHSTQSLRGLLHI